MAKKIDRLSALKVERTKKPGMYADGAGLWLRVLSSGAKSWIFRFMMNGRAREMGLGSANEVTLADARERAIECRRLRARGIDPIENRRGERQAAALEAAKAITFKECAEKYIASHKAAWRNKQHLRQWQNSLTKHVEPVIGGFSIQAIDTALVMRVLEPMWTAKTETASRLRQRIEVILDWAKVQGFR
ncbi:MAG TPA: Arm DNA-binding domain-containing protein, partial [Alphaproteobacteria bacterium]|nr:Arm DNA-binding domain-containing protein [Alphaproteobacteria bacterium]